MINKIINNNNEEEYGKLIWGNDTYRQNLTTLFPIKYYGIKYDTVNILSKGIIGIGRSFRHSGAMKKIEVFNGMDKDGGVEIMNTNNFLAIKWINLSISALHDDEPEEYAIVACIIYSNGNISIYFEKIPTEFGNIGGKLTITDGYDYATYNSTGLYIIKTSYSMIKTPEIMIRSGTLVEFTPNKICSEQKLCETCINASSLNEKCYWCPIINKCSHGFDIHRPLWMLKRCYIKNTTKCQESTTSVYTSDHELSSMRTTEHYSNTFPNHSFTNYSETTLGLSTTNSVFTPDHGLSSMRTTEHYSNTFLNYSFTNYSETTLGLSTTNSVFTPDHGLSSMRTTEHYSNTFLNYSFTNYSETTLGPSTTNTFNYKTMKNGLQTNQLPSFIWNNRNINNSGISLPLYSFILMPIALAILFLTLMCTLWLCIYKRSKKKNKRKVPYPNQSSSQFSQFK
uniref:Plexin domain-containing protein n=1 Tax=Schistosoma mansoni TaxID=6183 RepID=A0A5K4F6B5_SCHMA